MAMSKATIEDAELRPLQHPQNGFLTVWKRYALDAHTAFLFIGEGGGYRDKGEVKKQ